MSTPNAQFGGGIPENYDVYLGPFLFTFAAKDLGERIKRRELKSGDVLEVACGTGISTEHLRANLPDDVRIVATDVSEDMLAVAGEKRGALANVTYRVADAAALPFEDGCFDALVSQFGIMFLPDKQKTLNEWARVIAPGGSVIFNVWDAIEENKVIEVAMETLSEFFEGEPPPFLKVPFGFNDTEHIIELMNRAGFEACTSEKVHATVTHLDPTHIARGLVTGNPTILEINERATADAETIVHAMAEAIRTTFGQADGNPDISLHEIVFEGVKRG